MARYYVQAKRRSPRNPMSSVSEYVVMDGQENCGIQGFGTRMFGEPEALRRANAMRDELNAQDDVPSGAYPLTGTADQKLAWYAERNLLRV